MYQCHFFKKIIFQDFYTLILCHILIKLCNFNNLDFKLNFEGKKNKILSDKILSRAKKKKKLSQLKAQNK